MLWCRPSVAEAKLSFAAVADLIGRVGDEAFADLPDPQREALDVALMRRRPTARRPAARAIAAGFLTLIRGLAEERPLILAVDDWQWLDLPSRHALEFAARRLEDEPVGLLCSIRPPFTGSPAAGAAEERTTRVVLGPLSLAALGRIVGRAPGPAVAPAVPGADRPGERRQPVLRARDRAARGRGRIAAGRGRRVRARARRPAQADRGPRPPAAPGRPRSRAAGGGRVGARPPERRPRGARARRGGGHRDGRRGGEDRVQPTRCSRRPPTGRSPPHAAGSFTGARPTSSPSPRSGRGSSPWPRPGRIPSSRRSSMRGRPTPRRAAHRTRPRSWPSWPRG